MHIIFSHFLASLKYEPDTLLSLRCNNERNGFCPQQMKPPDPCVHIAKDGERLNISNSNKQTLEIERIKISIVEIFLLIKNVQFII